MGENYVLGNRNDENEFKPYTLDPRMFEGNKVVQVGCGTQHVVALALDGPDSKLPVLDQKAYINPPKLVEDAKPEHEDMEDEQQIGGEPAKGDWI